MVMSCIEVIPLESDLGPAVISLLLDECSLAPKVCIFIRPVECIKQKCQNHFHSNIIIRYYIIH